MNSKKYFTLATLVFIGFVSLQACGDPNAIFGGASSAALEGLWTETKWGETGFWEFQADGTYFWASGYSQQTGTWDMSEDQLLLDGSDWGFYVVITNNGNTMEWYEEDGYGVMLDFPSRTLTRQ